MVCKISPDGSIEWQAPCRVDVIGSYDSNLTVRSAGGDGQGRATALSFSGNPSKFLQGHNIFGSDDLVALVYDSFLRVCRVLGITPRLSELRSVRAGNYRCSRIDINYSYELPTRSDVLSWIRAAEFKSKTRHGRPSSKGGTLYWGKHSKRWALKAYSKGEEIERPKHGLPAALYETPLASWADNKLRLELVLRGKHLDEMNLSNAACWNQALVSRVYGEYLRRLEMTEQIRLSDELVLKLPQRLRSTYVLWQSGEDLRSTLPKATYYRHRKELLGFGINIDMRRQENQSSNVVPLVRILEAVPAEIPSWAFDMGLVHSSTARPVAC